MNINNKTYQYCENHSTPPNDYLNELERTTYLKTIIPRMLSGNIQGRFLSFISQIIQANYILEVGTFTAYASLCMAEGLQENGKLITLEANEELEPLIREYIQKSPYSNQVELIIGDALKEIPKLNYTFDLVFIDAAKKDYWNYFNLIIEKVRKGGIIIADNVLWEGKVLEEPKDHQKSTAALHDFNNKILNDNRVNNLIIPLRDGLNIIIKK